MQFPPLVPPTKDTSHHSLDELINQIQHEKDVSFETSLLFHAENPMIGLGDADPLLWAQMAFWTPDEVAALSLGKNPTIVNYESCLEEINRHQICRDFMERREIILRAIATGQMFDRTYPTHAVAWLERFKIHFPPSLRQAIEQLDLQIADWKTLYDGVVERAVALEEALAQADEAIQTQQQHVEQNADFQVWFEEALEALKGQAEVIESKDAKIANLQLELEELQQTIQSLSNGDLSTRERGSLLKLTLGMAMEQYGYSPKDSKSPSIPQIVDDLNVHGLSLSDDTVRKYLKEATDKHWERQPE